MSTVVNNTVPDLPQPWGANNGSNDSQRTDALNEEAHATDDIGSPLIVYLASPVATADS